MTQSDSCQLYLITPSHLDATAFSSLLAAALDAGGVAAVQLRLKETNDDEIRRACATLLPVARAHDVAFLLNDRADLAAEMGCDGVHVGQQDMPYAAARKILGADAIVGVTCHDSRHLAMEAAECGADYVAFGAFFPTTTKEARFHAEPDLLTWWSEVMVVPCVAIGGITIDNCLPLIEAGADFLAVSAGVWAHPAGPAAAVRAFTQALGQTAPSTPRR